MGECSPSRFLQECVNGRVLPLRSYPGYPLVPQRLDHQARPRVLLQYE